MLAMLWTFALVVLLLVVVCWLGIALFIFVNHRRYDHLPGPPRTGFFMGNGLELKNAKAKEHGIARILLRWAEEYGPCYKIFVFHICLIVTTGPSFAKEFLTKSKYQKSKQIYATTRYIFGKRCLGDGLFSEVDHAKWHKRRSVVGPAFNKRCLRLFMEQFNCVMDRWISNLMEVADGKTAITLWEEFSKLTLDAISEIGFSDQVNALEMKGSNRFSSATRTLLEGIIAVSDDIFIQLRPSKAAFRKSVCEALDFLRSHGRRLIEERQNFIASGAEPPDDMLNHIIKYKEAVDGVTDEDLIDDFVTLFVAGQDTTATALSWLFMDIGRHPQVLEKVVAEVDQVLGNKTEMEFSDLSKLEYIDRVIKESLRLHCPAPNSARETVEEVTVEGYRIPAGSNILIPLYTIQNLPNHHNNPSDFNPDRFLQRDIKDLFTYLPFSVGSRSCIGKQFALMEIKVVLCKFLQRFNHDLDPDQSFDMMDDSSVRPQSGTIVSITHRDK